MNEIELKTNENKEVEKNGSEIMKNENKTAIESKIVTHAPKKKKKKKSMLKWIIILIILLAAVFTVYFAIKSRANAADGNYSLAAAEYRDITVSVSGTGTVEPVDSYEVKALVKGEVTEAPFEEGDVIQKGELLYQIDSSDVENNIKQSEIGLEKQKSSYNELQENLKDLNITATKSGQVTKLYVEEGDTVTAGESIADIMDKTTMLVEVDFNSTDVASMHPGQSAQVMLPSKMETIGGVIDSISPVKSASTQGAVVQAVKIKVKNPGALTSDTYAEATIGEAVSAKGGNFTYNVEETVTAQAAGKVSKVNVSEGDLVTKGQSIISLSSTSLNSQNQSSALSVKDAEVSLKSAKDSLEDYRITSPISGTIIEKNFKVGDTLDATSSTVNMVTIYDMSSLTFAMDIDELDIDKVEVGQTVEITADAVEGKTFTGKVDKISINGTTENGTTSYPVTVVIDDPQNLLPGMNVTANVMIEQAKNVLAIPVGAVTRGNTVLVQNANAASESGDTQTAAASTTKSAASGSQNEVPGFTRITVELGRNDDDYIEIVNGLKDGDKVYVENTSGASNNMGMFGGGMGGGGIQGGPAAGPDNGQDVGQNGGEK